MKQKLMAFWQYDLFPKIMLYGEVERMEAGGFVSIKGYTGMMFNPIIILPWKEGQKKAEKFETIKAEYDAKMKKAKSEFYEELKKEVGFKP